MYVALIYLLLLYTESRDRNKAKLLVYCGATDPRSFGGLVFKAANDDLEVVGLHRGGMEANWDKKKEKAKWDKEKAKEETKEETKGYNYGSYFLEIIESIKENWDPLGN